MLDSIYIETTRLTPEVQLDPRKGIFRISGRSLPEDVLLFYTPILDWIKKYVKDPEPITEFSFELEYFNSSTARIIIKILIELEEIVRTGKKIYVKWYYTKGDALMKDKGEEIKSVVLLPFELIEAEEA